MKQVSVLIINYNTFNLTVQCVESVIRETHGVDYEIIIVDNASLNDEASRLKLRFPNVIVIPNDINVGFGRANNLAYKYSSGKYIFLLNSDTILCNNAIAMLVNFLDNHTDVAIVGGTLLGSNGCEARSYYVLLPSLLKEVDDMLRGPLRRIMISRLKYRVRKSGWSPVGYIMGADMMLRRDDIERMGFFSEDFFMYYEESEMSLRYAKAGMVSAYYAEPRIIHLEGKSFTQSEWKTRVLLHSRKIYYLKHHSYKYYCATNICYLINLCIGIVANLLCGRLNVVRNSLQTMRILCTMKDTIIF